MQPVNNNIPQHQVVSQQRNQGSRESALHSAEMSSRRKISDDPVDIVNLSTFSSSNPDSGVTKKPSVPVTSVEKQALRDSFSVYA